MWPVPYVQANGEYPSNGEAVDANFYRLETTPSTSEVRMDVGPVVALIAVALGTPYLAWRKQWLLAGYCIATAASVVFSSFLGAPEVGQLFLWLSILLLGIGAYQLIRRHRAEAGRAV